MDKVRGYSFLVFTVLIICGCSSLKNTKIKDISFSISKFSTLPALVNECSGMTRDESGMFMINDGGSGPLLYHLNLDGNDTIAVIGIEDAENIDWEAVVDYKDEILICDFGNNLGKRTDLKIYHVDKSTFKLNSTMSFKYPDQTSFDDPRHNFDCEGMVMIDDQYVLFSKNRGNKNSNIYAAKVGTSDFKLQDSILVPGLVTDAYYDSVSDKILLTSYNYSVLGGFQSQLSIVSVSSKGKYKTERSFDIEFPEQFEAITKIRDNEFLIGSENGFAKGGNLYKIDVKGL